MPKTLAEIDERRSRLGVAQAEMCRRADVSESTISRARAEGRELSPRIRAKLESALQRISDERGVVIVDELPNTAE